MFFFLLFCCSYWVTIGLRYVKGKFRVRFMHCTKIISFKLLLYKKKTSLKVKNHFKNNRAVLRSVLQLEVDQNIEKKPIHDIHKTNYYEFFFLCRLIDNFQLQYIVFSFCKSNCHKSEQKFIHSRIHNHG